MKKVAVRSGCEKAEKIAEELGLDIVDNEESSEFVIVVTSHGMALKKCGTAMKPFIPNFSRGKVDFRVRFAKGPDALVKAVGGSGSVVCDVTAGFGYDAFVLRSRGCSVTMIERSPIVHSLLADAIARAQSDSWASKLVGEKFDLVLADSNSFLTKNVKIFDAIYLDPMFPDRNSSALPRKEMQFLAGLLSRPASSEIRSLFELAKRRARRVVIKRPVKAAPLVEPVLTQFTGTSTRFDVYISS